VGFRILHTLHDVGPEDPSHDGGLLQRLAQIGIQAIQARL
jgi:hypothetical protein